jgi:hypothetical protein
MFLNQLAAVFSDGHRQKQIVELCARRNFDDGFSTCSNATADRSRKWGRRDGDGRQCALKPVGQDMVVFRSLVCRQGFRR